MVGEILRGMRLELAFGRHLPITEGEEQEPVLVEGNLAAEVSAAGGYRLKELLNVGDPIVLEPPADERGRGRHRILRSRRLATLL